jgi:uncharacterized membrane protein YjgN (DUF898 family)
MRSYFSTEIKGVHLLIFILIIAVSIYIGYTSAGSQNDVSSGSITDLVSFFQQMFIQQTIIVILAFIAQYMMVAALIKHTAFEGVHFQFDGSFITFVLLNALWIVLTCITLGLYYPWYMRNITHYLAKHASYKDQPFEFKSSGSGLFLIFFGFYLLFFVLMFMPMLAGNGDSAAVALLMPLLLFIFVGFFYFVYIKWFVNFQLGEHTITFQDAFWHGSGYLIIQLLLTLCTLGIYFPAAYVRIWRYMVANTEVKNATTGEVNPLGFSGEVSTGFFFIWGQTLLLMITAGIYTPWFYARLFHWFINQTYIDGRPEPEAGFMQDVELA